jgi:hypothetical protein
MPLPAYGQAYGHQPQKIPAQAHNNDAIMGRNTYPAFGPPAFGYAQAPRALSYPLWVMPCVTKLLH